MTVLCSPPLPGLVSVLIKLCFSCLEFFVCEWVFVKLVFYWSRNQKIELLQTCYWTSSVLGVHISYSEKYFMLSRTFSLEEDDNTSTLSNTALKVNVTESHRMAGVGRHFWKSSGSTHCSGKSLDNVVQNHVQKHLKISKLTFQATICSSAQSLSLECTSRCSDDTSCVWVCVHCLFT